MDTVILGAGLSGISMAYFLQKDAGQDSIILLEKENVAGGLCRSIRKNDYVYDIGPHILFSKDKEILEIILTLLGRKNNLKRSNQILYQGHFVQYPFENDLSKLPEKELKECIHTFNHNPYEDYQAENMLHFFLKTFGEGITNIYLRPYNEKIWKYDPSFMDTSMVERIPKPTAEEIRRSATGETLDGYIHQLHFSYPEEGGIESVPKAFLERLNTSICKVELNSEVIKIERNLNKFQIVTKDGKMYSADQLISTIPVPILSDIYVHTPFAIKKNAASLRYNSIVVVFVKTPYDLCGENFTFTIPDKEILFHRISKMDFLGTKYHKKGEATYMIEVTYRKNDQVDMLKQEIFLEKIMQGMVNIGFAKKKEDVEIIDSTSCEYAYVIYDLHHKRNMECIRSYFSKEGILLTGRFGNFEYWNMDRVVRESLELAKIMQECRYEGK